MAEIKQSAFAETIVLNDEDYITIIQDGQNKKVKVGLLKGNESTNVTEEYIELDSEDGATKYRLKVNEEGKLYAYNSEIDTAEPPLETDNALYDGLIINQMYGGGTTKGLETACSHSFVELYNITAFPINLKGLYLWYKSKTGSWKPLELRGIVPPFHSFLIKGNAHYDINSDLVRCKIYDYDQYWDISFSDKGFSMWLAIGGSVPSLDNPPRVTKDEFGVIKTIHPRYIDLLGAGGIDNTDTITAYEEYYDMGMGVDSAVRRIDYSRSSNKSGKVTIISNQKSSEIINYRQCKVEHYRPRSLSDGTWDLYVDKIRLNENIPNYVNICYGKNGDTSRTFTWQSCSDEDGYLKYKKITDNKWKKIESTREYVQHHNQDAYIHRVILHDLSEGIYEYQAGVNGGLSEVEEFEIKTYDTTHPLRFLWTTDQQGWTEYEYKAWETTMKNIEKHESNSDGSLKYDFHMNTGDISQNANRIFEFGYYHKWSRKSTRNMPHMATCGNNDLVDKKYGYCFNYYQTFEDSPKLNEYKPIKSSDTSQEMVSTCSYDVGFTHFVCLNSNAEYMYNGVTTEEFLQKQCDFLDKDLTAVSQRSTKPRWIICYMHLSPFTCVRTARVQMFIEIFEKHKVDLVLCG